MVQDGPYLHGAYPTWMLQDHWQILSGRGHRRYSSEADLRLHGHSCRYRYSDTGKTDLLKGLVADRLRSSLKGGSTHRILIRMSDNS